MSDPAEIRSQDDLVAALRRRRAELRLTCLQLDHRAGFHDGYTAHLENPHARTGRNSLKLNPLAVAWLDALRMRLVIVPDDGAA